MYPAAPNGSDGQRVTGTMPVDLAPRGYGAVSRSVDRRTLLLGATGALVAGGMGGHARAAGHAQSLAARSGPRLDPALARKIMVDNPLRTYARLNETVA